MKIAFDFISESLDRTMTEKVRAKREFVDVLFVDHIRLAEEERRWQLRKNALDQFSSDNILLLTILAAVFLPLTLAASLQSMQTPFTQLHNLLYMFFALSIFMGHAIFLGYKVFGKILDSSRRAEWNDKFKKDSREFVIGKRRLGKGVRVLFILAWAMAFTSSIIGVSTNISLGLKVLGYSIGGAVVILVIVFLFTCLSYCFDIHSYVIYR
jgi:Na+/proline symporter